MAVTDVMKPVFETTRLGRDVCLAGIRTWVDFGQRVPELFSVPRAEGVAWPRQWIDTSFDIAHKWLGVQQELALAMVAAAEPILSLGRAEEAKPEPKGERAAKAIPAEKTAG